MINSKAGVFNSGNMQTAKTGAVIPGPRSPVYSMNFNTIPVNNLDGARGSHIEDFGVNVPVQNNAGLSSYAANIKIDNLSIGDNTFQRTFDNEDQENFSISVTPAVENLRIKMHLHTERNGLVRCLIGRNIIATPNGENFVLEGNQTIEQRDEETGSGDYEWYTIQGTIAPSMLLASASSPATPSTEIIDFSQTQNVKNKTGLACLFGITSQYISEGGFMFGISVNYGRTGSTSTLDYAAGSITGTQFQKSDPITFSMKDSGYVSELAQVGYAWGRINPYFIFGLAQHRAKFWCPDAYQNAENQITKGYNTPVFGLGLNVAVTKNVYVTLQWQRHCGGVKDWGKVNTLLPRDRIAMGSPQTRLGSTTILMGVTCMSNFGNR